MTESGGVAASRAGAAPFKWWEKADRPRPIDQVIDYFGGGVRSRGAARPPDEPATAPRPPTSAAA